MQGCRPLGFSARFQGLGFKGLFLTTMWCKLTVQGLKLQVLYFERLRVP